MQFSEPCLLRHTGPSNKSYPFRLYIILLGFICSVVSISSGVYGSVPQHLLDQEDGLIKQLHFRCPDLDDLKGVSENAQKQYVRSRSQPAPESIKRAKKMPACIPLHPLLESLCSSTEVAQCQLLSHLKQYKPSQVGNSCTI